MNTDRDDALLGIPFSGWNTTNNIVWKANGAYKNLIRFFFLYYRDLHKTARAGRPKFRMDHAAMGRVT